MITPEMVSGWTAIEDHPTIPLCLTSCIHYQLQAGFKGDIYSPPTAGEGYGFLWLQWETAGSICRSITWRFLHQTVQDPDFVVQNEGPYEPEMW